MTKPLSKDCPYGTYRRVTGPTKRAKSFRKWQADARKQFEGVPYLKTPPDKLAVVGDCVYTPYAHMSMNKDLPYDSHGGFLSSGTNFLKLSDFNVETIQKIVNFYPQAFFGGTIYSYQSEEIPKFISHLEEVFPDLYKQLLIARPEYIERFKLNAPKNYVGRKALIKTLAPCTFYTKGSRSGEYKVQWTWDGEKLTTNTEHAYSSTWGEVRDFESVQTVLIPSDKSEIEITDNKQVGSKTIFIN